MFQLEESPEEPGSPPPSPWGGSPVPSQPGTPSPEARARLASDLGGSGGGSGDPPALRGRSRSAPPVLWAAQRYGRRLRRMSDEFQLQVLPRPRSVGGAPPGGGWREALRAWWGSRRSRPAPPAPPP
ncbi:bcl2-associated agonist of cell death [Cyanocitta cristata]